VIRKILECHDGYWVAGFKQRSNTFLDAHLMKIDSNANIVWEKSLGDWKLDEIGTAISRLDSNRFIVGVITTICGRVPVGWRAVRFW
jgi:hypothetical protein